ncbi:hypothetical protein [Telluribacter humicola]|uniref:hypothetical protein n=1 Tax=Telluribacter humicola TaxID=1720261 RepID=UPI001A964135|nr:hypothetical protein [Telluribacter humicola]
MLSIIIGSCCDIDTETTYGYKGTKIKRVDECGKTTFYYQDIDGSATRIWAEYSGINDGFSGYLKFREDGKVFLLSGDGYFQTANPDTSKFEYERIYSYERDAADKTIYFIELSTRYEKEENVNTATEVKIKYEL